MPEETPFDVRRLLRLAGRHTLLILLCTAIGVGVTALPMLRSGFSYTATSQTQIGMPATVMSVTAAGPSTRDDNARLMDSQLRRMEGGRIAAAVERQLPDGHPPYEVDFTGASDTSVIVTNVTATNSALAVKVANLYSTEYVASLTQDNDAVVAATEKQLSTSIDGLNDQLTKLQQALSAADKDSLTQVQAVVSPTRSALLDQRTALQRQLDGVALYKSVGSSGGAKSIQPADKANASAFDVISQLLLGAIIGLVVGLGLTWLLEQFRGKVRDEDDIRSAGLEAIPTLNLADLPNTDASEPGRYAAQLLAVTLFPATGSAEPTLLTPLENEEGRSTEVAVLVADELSQMGRRVIVVDAVPGGASFPAAANLDIVAFESVRAGDGGPVVSSELGQRLTVVTAAQGNTLALLGSSEFGEWVSGLVETNDHVIVIGSSLTDSAEALEMARLAARVVVLVPSGLSRRRTLRRLATRLEGLGSMFDVLRRPVVVLYSPVRGSVVSRTAKGSGSRKVGSRSAPEARTESALSEADDAALDSSGAPTPDYANETSSRSEPQETPTRASRRTQSSPGSR